MSASYVSQQPGTSRTFHIGNLSPRDLLPVLLGARGDTCDSNTGGDQNYMPQYLLVDGQKIPLTSNPTQYEQIFTPYIPLQRNQQIDTTIRNINAELADTLSTSTNISSFRMQLNKSITGNIENSGDITTAYTLYEENKEYIDSILQTLIDQTPTDELGQIFNRYVNEQ
jgi:hypothetical protein